MGSKPAKSKLSEELKVLTSVKIVPNPELPMLASISSVPPPIAAKLILLCTALEVPISSVPWSIVTPPEKVLLLAVKSSVPGPLTVSEPLPVAPTPPPFEPVSSAMTSEITIFCSAAGANTRF